MLISETIRPHLEAGALGRAMDELVTLLASGSRKFQNPEESHNFNAVSVPQSYSFEDWIAHQGMLAQMLLWRNPSCDRGIELMKRICQVRFPQPPSVGELSAIAKIQHQLARALEARGDLGSAFNHACHACWSYEHAGLQHSVPSYLAQLTRARLAYEENLLLSRIKEQRLILILQRGRALLEEESIDLHLATGDFHFSLFLNAHRAFHNFRDSPEEACTFLAKLADLDDAAYGTFSGTLDIPNVQILTFLMAQTRFLDFKERCLRLAFASFREAFRALEEVRGPYNPSLMDPLRGLSKVSKELKHERGFEWIGARLAELEGLFGGES